MAIALAAASLMAAAPAGAQMADTQDTLLLNGQGYMTVNSTTNPPGETWSWERCPADGMGACTPHGTGRQITTGDAPAGVFFRATSNLGAVATSKVWNGRVQSLGAPSVIGEVRANELVTPVSGPWAGGWPGDFDQFQLAACRTASGEGCLTITDPSYGGCLYGAAVLDPALTGRYLRVATMRYGSETAFPAIARTTPYGGSIWSATPIASVAVVGLITDATGSRAAPCGPPPMESGSISRRGVATVGCLLGCQAVLKARSGKRRARKALAIGSATGAAKRDEPQRLDPAAPIPHELRLSRAALRKLGRRARVALIIDGEQVARRTVSLRPPAA